MNNAQAVERYNRTHPYYLPTPLSCTGPSRILIIPAAEKPIVNSPKGSCHRMAGASVVDGPQYVALGNDGLLRLLSITRAVWVSDGEE